MRDVCFELAKVQPGFLTSDCNSNEIRGEVASKFDTEPTDPYAQRLFRSMKENHCGDRIWRLMRRIIILFRKIRSELPAALSRYDEIRKNVYDICFIHSNYEPRMKLYEHRDKPSTPRLVSLDIEMLVQECNLFHAIVYNASAQDTLRGVRDTAKRFAVEVTNYDPSVLTFEAQYVDDLLNMLDDGGTASLMMRRASQSANEVANTTARLMLAATKANSLLDEAQSMIAKSINEIYDLGVFAKYFQDVMEVISEGQKYALSKSNATDSALPHGLDLPSVIVTMVENNVGEKARDSVFGQPEKSPERLAVVRLIGGLNIVIARGASELPTSSEMFELKSRIKMYSMSLYRLNSAAIDNPTVLSPDEITNILATPSVKGKLRELQKEPDLHKIVTLLLHEINDFQVSVKFLATEAKRLASTIRQFDETISPDLGILTTSEIQDAAKNIRQDEMINKVMELARARKYLESLEVYLQGDDLDYSAELINVVKQYLEVMRVLSGQIPRTISFQDLTGRRNVLVSLFNDLDDFTNNPTIYRFARQQTLVQVVSGSKTSSFSDDTSPFPDPSQLSSIEMSDYCSDLDRQTALRNIAGLDSGNSTVTMETFEINAAASKNAQFALQLCDQLSSLTSDAVQLIRLLGESLHRITAGNPTAGSAVTPDPTNQNITAFVSMLYDYHVWPSVRIDDMAFRLDHCNATSLKDDRNELISFVKQAGISGGIHNKGIIEHILVDLIVGLLGVGDIEILLREALMNIQGMIAQYTFMKRTNPAIFDEMNCEEYIPPLRSYYSYNAKVRMAKGCTNTPTSMAIALQHVTVISSSTQLMRDRCQGSCLPTLESPTLDAGSAAVSGCAHLTTAGDPTLYSSIIPPKGRMDVARHAVKCCHPQGKIPVSATLYGCHESSTYWEAKEICESAKFRLCTQQEVNSCITCNTGCGFDRMRIWTSDIVGSCSNEAPEVSPMSYDMKPPDEICLHICDLSTKSSRNAEIIGGLSNFFAEYATIVRKESPQCVPSIINMEINIEGDQGTLIRRLSSDEAVSALLRCIEKLPHGMPRIHANTLLHVTLSYNSAFTWMIDGGPGTPPIQELDPDQNNQGPCSGNGVFANGLCICGPGRTGEKCEYLVEPEQAYQDGWRKGFEASLTNITAFSQPRDVITRTSNLFDSAAKLLKSTTLAMAKSDPPSEARVPTSYLSPVELMVAIEDSSWIDEYRSGPSSTFNSVIPKILKEATLVRREYDDIATMLKHSAIRASTIDCKSMSMVAKGPNSRTPSCGEVAQALTEMDRHEILNKCLSGPVIAEFGTILKSDTTATMKHIIDDMMELIDVILIHSECPAQCNRRGVCILNQCECFEGWTGAACTHEVALPPGVCPRNCTGHGKCTDGKCKCDPGWKSSDCSYSTACPNNCWSHGDCIDGKCLCFRRWRGYDCSIAREVCPDDYKCLHGNCVNTRCVCEQGWTGDDCTIGDFVHKGSDSFWDDEGVSPTVFLASGSEESGHGKVKVEDMDLIHPWV